MKDIEYLDLNEGLYIENNILKKKGNYILFGSN